jgi:hypothetical protein
MEGEHSLVLEEVVGGKIEVSRPKAIVAGSSSRDASSDRSGYGFDAQGEENRVVDPCESARNYDFGALTVTVGHIQQLEALGYFAEGFAHEPGEEVVPEAISIASSLAMGQ